MSDWTKERLQRMIADQVEESTELDYKRCAALTKTDKHIGEVSKDVSSFANSHGGEIIYGIVEEGHRPVALDEGFDPAIITKEWVEDIITGSIRPRIDGLVVHPVALKSTAPERQAYVVEIPQSSTAHQAKDRRYYRRRNFKSEPMEDYEIRDIMNRRKFPSVVAEFQCKRTKTDRDKDIAEYRLGVILRNTGVIRAIDVKLVMELPAIIVCGRPPHISARRTTASTGGLPSYEALELTVKSISEVIFPGDEWRLTEETGYHFDFRIDKDVFTNFLPNYRPVLAWTVYADDMPPKSGAKPIRDLQDF